MLAARTGLSLGELVPLLGHARSLLGTLLAVIGFVSSCLLVLDRSGAEQLDRRRPIGAEERAQLRRVKLGLLERREVAAARGLGHAYDVCCAL